MPEDEQNLSHYLLELYRNLNLITADILETEPMDPDLDATEVTRTLEKQFSEWMGSFYHIIVYLFCTTIAFLISVVNIDYRPLAVTMAIIFPLYLWFTFFYSIPEVKVQGQVIFSRKDLTLVKQFKLARSLFSFFMHQLWDNTKIGVTIMNGFVVLLLWNVLQVYLL